jgi:hypothetical protein
MSQQAINVERLDIRLGRHHNILSGPNVVPQSLMDFCRVINSSDLEQISEWAGNEDPEIAVSKLRNQSALAPAHTDMTKSSESDSASVSKMDRTFAEAGRVLRRLPGKSFLKRGWRNVTNIAKRASEN